MAFINNIKKTLDDEYNYSVTENGDLVTEQRAKNSWT